MTSTTTTDLALRQARLRPEAEARYSWVPANTWLPASTLAAAVVHHAEGGGPAPSERALADDAFEFRGGRPEVMLRQRARTRWSDYPYPSAMLHRQRTAQGSSARDLYRDHSVEANRAR